MKFSDFKKHFQPDFNQVIFNTLNNPGIKQQIIDLNQSQLMDEGLDANGKFINTIEGNPYTEYTKEQKRKKGQPTDHVTLYDTGEFYQSMKVTINGQGAEVLADFSKGGSDIRDNFNSSYDFLGLTDNSKEKLKEWLLLEIFSRELRQAVFYA